MSKTVLKREHLLNFFLKISKNDKVFDAPFFICFPKFRIYTLLTDVNKMKEETRQKTRK